MKFISKACKIDLLFLNILLHTLKPIVLNPLALSLSLNRPTCTQPVLQNRTPREVHFTFPDSLCETIERPFARADCSLNKNNNNNNNRRPERTSANCKWTHTVGKILAPAEDYLFPEDMFAVFAEASNDYLGRGGFPVQLTSTDTAAIFVNYSLRHTHTPLSFLTVKQWRVIVPARVSFIAVNFSFIWRAIGFHQTHSDQTDSVLGNKATTQTSHQCCHITDTQTWRSQWMCTVTMGKFAFGCATRA